MRNQEQDMYIILSPFLFTFFIELSWKLNANTTDRSKRKRLLPPTSKDFRVQIQIEIMKSAHKSRIEVEEQKKGYI